MLATDIQQNRGLLNVFCALNATPEQLHDMLTFYEVGIQAFKQYITCYILQNPTSTNAPLRRHKLLTMATVKPTKTKVKQKEKEAKQVITCLRKRLVWCNHTKLPYDQSLEQYSIMPRALADEDGNPHKGNKSNWSDKLESRYKSTTPTVFTNTLALVPQAVIIDVMFIINTKPLRRTKTFVDYATLLFNRFVLDHYKAGVNEVHLVFDTPDTQQFNPKQFEHAKRYSSKHHEHTSFTATSGIPQAWRKHLDCRSCKRAIVEAIGHAYLQKGCSLLRGGQVLIIAGCFSGPNDTWRVSNELTPQMVPEYSKNTMEADSKI